LPVEATRRRRGRGPGGPGGADHLAAPSAEGDAAITLGVLDAVHDNASLSQRSLASELGIALGLTNAYIRRCVHRGFVKVAQAPANRYAYYLTPKGFAEKSRLTARYLSSSLTLYRRARTQCDELLTLAAARRWQRLALFGIGDVAEIAMLCAIGRPLVVVGAVAPRAAGGSFLHLPVAATLAQLGPVDGVLFAELQRPQAAYDALVRDIAADRVLVPALLKVNPARSITPAAGLRAAQRVAQG
jgi:DNA-binding MarR family transcriptional regulator